MKESQPPEISEQFVCIQARCGCPPLSPQRDPASLEHACMLIAPELRQMLQTALIASTSQVSPCSLLVLHITQVEPLPQAPAQHHQRLKYHAPATFLAQIVQYMHRSLRADDQILVEENGSGAALLLPGVDQEGLAHIARRVSQNIHLLQAETVVPPLRAETEVTFGWGTSPGSSDALNILFEQVGQVRERVVFRPAIAVSPAERPRPAGPRSRSALSQETHPRETHAGGIPFMQLPSRLPIRLQRLIPHALALELRCAPVGRDHNRLTVAMANPTDPHAIHHLREATGMSICPASCELVALETLLTSGW